MEHHEKQEATLRNDFGVVRVEVVEGPTQGLRITDVRTDQSIVLDPLELECLAWAEHDALRPLLDPSRTRWISD